MNHVFVVDTNKQPLSMCHPARAMLRKGKAAVVRRFPFRIILFKTIPDAVVKAVRSQGLHC